MLGALPRPGQPPDEGHLTRDILEVLRAGFAGEGSAGAPPASGAAAGTLPAGCSEITLPDGRSADVMLHRHGDLLLAEFEPHIAGIGSASPAPT